MTRGFTVQYPFRGLAAGLAVCFYTASIHLRLQNSIASPTHLKDHLSTEKYVSILSSSVRN